MAAFITMIRLHSPEQSNGPILRHPARGIGTCCILTSLYFEYPSSVEQALGSKRTVYKRHFMSRRQMSYQRYEMFNYVCLRKAVRLCSPKSPPNASGDFSCTITPSTHSTFGFFSIIFVHFDGLINLALFLILNLLVNSLHHTNPNHSKASHRHPFQRKDHCHQ